MLRALLVCAAACAACAPAFADVRDEDAPISADAAALLEHHVQPTAQTPAPAMLPLDLDDFDARLTPGRFVVLSGSGTPANAEFVPGEPRALPDWNLGERFPEITALAGGAYAVRDTLASYRKPRAYRPSALGTMLVLRIDDSGEAPSLRVGGGGVTSALWAVMPKH